MHLYSYLVKQLSWYYIYIMGAYFSEYRIRRNKN